jgi:hypothetical protein
VARNTLKALVLTCLMWGVALLLLSIVVSYYHTREAKAALLAQVPACIAPQWCTVTSFNSTGANVLNATTVITNGNAWAVGAYNYHYNDTGRTLAEHWNGTNWSVVTTVDTGTYSGHFDDVLYGVSAGSPISMWVVGDYHDDGSSMVEPSLVEVYSSTANSWSIIPSANPGGYVNQLNAVSAVSSTLAWAVGLTETTGSGLVGTLVESCSLSQCTNVASPNVLSSTEDILNGVVSLSSSNAWAVGYYFQASGGHSQPLILHYDGSSWTIDSHSQVNCNGSDTISLNKVDAYSSNDVWAVGTDQNGFYVRPLIEHYDGSSWTCTLLTPPGGLGGGLNSVFIGNERDLWAVGSYGNTSGGNNNLIEHWHGSALTDTAASNWDVISETNVTANNELLGVSAPAAAGISSGGKIIITSTWGAGDSSDSSGQNNRTLVEGIAAPAPPPNTTSYYVTNTNIKTHYVAGYCAGANGRGGVIILDYGEPITYTTSPTTVYGTALLDTYNTLTTTYAISASAESYTDGYDDGYRGHSPKYTTSCSPGPLTVGTTIALGINNFNQSTVPQRAAALVPGHAQNWSNMVSDIIAHTVVSGYSEIAIAAAADIEPNWSNPGPVEDWVNSYAATNASPLYDYGSTDNYPCDSPSMPLAGNLTCSPWTAEQIYTASSGISGTLALPEIYHNSYSMYWYQVARWGVKQYNRPTRFIGVMTECGSSDCTNTDYTQAEGWETLWLGLNADLATHQTPLFETDIACMTSPCAGNQLREI